jgi:hypothetical protein
MRAAALATFAVLALLAWSAQSQTKPQSNRQTNPQTETQTTTQNEQQTKPQNERQTQAVARPLPPTVMAAQEEKTRSGFSGLVLGMNGQPCAGVTVFVGSHGINVASAATDDRGVFAVDLPPGDYTLGADDDMGASDPIDLSLAAGERLDGLTLELKEYPPPRITVETLPDGRKLYRFTEDVIIY